MSDEDENTLDDTTGAGTDRADEDGNEQLGDAGKKALDAMKGKWQTERDARKERDAEIAQLKAQLAKNKGSDGGKPEQPDLDEVRKQAKAELAAEMLRDRALDKIEAKAAKLFADPEDAAALLARKVDDFIDGGKVDTEAIEDALADLLKKKPHLAATVGKRFAGSADGGARKGSKPDQLTRQDLKHMKPDEIVKAQEEGRLNDLMGVTT